MEISVPPEFSSKVLAPEVGLNHPLALDYSAAPSPGVMIKTTILQNAKNSSYLTLQILRLTWIFLHKFCQYLLEPRSCQLLLFQPLEARPLSLICFVFLSHFISSLFSSMLVSFGDNFGPRINHATGHVNWLHCHCLGQNHQNASLECRVS